MTRAVEGNKAQEARVALPPIAGVTAKTLRSASGAALAALWWAPLSATEAAVREALRVALENVC